MRGVLGVHGVLRGSEFTYEDKNLEKVEKWGLISKVHIGRQQQKC